MFFFSLTKNMRTMKKIWTIQKPLKVFRKPNPRPRNPNPKLRKLMSLRTPLLMMARTNLSLILTLRFVSFLLHTLRNLYAIYERHSKNFISITLTTDPKMDPNHIGTHICEFYQFPQFCCAVLEIILTVF